MKQECATCLLLAVTLAAEIHAVSWVAWPALALPAAPQNALVPGGRAARFSRLRGGADEPATLERGPIAASEPAQGQDVGVAGADAIGCEGVASPMRELQERINGMRMGGASNASTSASGFKAKECTFIPGFDGPRRCAQTEHVSQQQSQHGIAVRYSI